MKRTHSGIGRLFGRNSGLQLSSDEALAAEKEREAERTEYRRKYWQEYSKKVRRVFGVLSQQDHAEAKARADEHGRSVWAQIWAEAEAYRSGRRDPSPEVAANQEQLISELRRVGNNLNQLAKLGHIEAKRGGGIAAKSNIGTEALRLIERLETAVDRYSRTGNDR